MHTFFNCRFPVLYRNHVDMAWSEQKVMAIRLDLQELQIGMTVRVKGLQARAKKGWHSDQKWQQPSRGTTRAQWTRGCLDLSGGGERSMEGDGCSVGR